ncbi:hypothetical protein NIES4102_01380 [Chondrocystis sp. NIES-4102]|nr:hypothetical protein NIES4102_01380 [Chondrocystis sp. NIES-4102]
MSSNSSDKPDKNPINNHLKSSIVHKPFDTGTINIFSPYKNTTAKLSTDAQLEAEKLIVNANIDNQKSLNNDHWLDSILNPWGISAIALVFLANFISGGFIWRNEHLASTAVNKPQLPLVGNVNLVNREFIPLNLSTLSTIKIDSPKPELKSQLTPIPPALAPLENIGTSAVINPQYYYILTEYAGEQSLSIAQQHVKQISLVNLPQGVFIYLGAFTDKQQAQEFVAQLKLKNFQSYVYPLPG